MSATLRIDYCLTEADYLEGLRACLARTKRQRYRRLLARIFGGLAILAGAAALLSGEPFVVPTLVLIAGIPMLFMTEIGLFFAKRGFRKDHRLQESFSSLVSDKGVTAESSKAKTDYLWSSF